MKMMMINSLVETGGWGTPLIPGGGNKVVKVVVESVARELAGKPASLAEGVILCPPTPRGGEKEASVAEATIPFTALGQLRPSGRPPFPVNHFT